MPAINKMKTTLDLSKYIEFSKNKYYKGPIPLKTANKYNDGSLKLPLNVLEENEKNDPIKEKEYLVYWFRNDLRIQDNTGFYNFINECQERKLSPLTLFIISTRFLNSHLESYYKLKFLEKNLTLFREKLRGFGIPLSIIYLDDDDNTYTFGDSTFQDFHSWFQFVINKKFRSNTVFFNIDYNYDEIERDITLLEHTKLNIRVFHDLCVVKPLEIKSNKNTQYSMFSPWFKKWESHIASNPIELLDIKESDLSFKPATSDPIDVINDLTQFNKFLEQLKTDSLLKFGVTEKQVKETQDSMKPGENEARKVLKNFIKSDIKEYNKGKDTPSSCKSSRLSHYITLGLISTREIVHSLGKIKSKDSNIENFKREVAWRDFYKHSIVRWPFLMMFLPFNFSSLDIKWSEPSSNNHLQKWMVGETGVPIVDASMRELLNTGYLNNRCRMISATYLTKILAIDWRIGERWFYNHLADGDFASNLGGWGYIASCGLNCQPWFRIFNTTLQSEKYDSQGNYIATWIPQLSKLGPKRIHDPYGDDDEKNEVDEDEIAEITNSYPKPIINRKRQRVHVLDLYKEAM